MDLTSHLSSLLPSGLLLLVNAGVPHSHGGLKNYNDVRGKLFESLAHRILGEGGSFDVWDLEMGVQRSILGYIHVIVSHCQAMLCDCFAWRNQSHCAFHTCCYEILLSRLSCFCRGRNNSEPGSMHKLLHFPRPDGGGGPGGRDILHPVQVRPGSHR